MTKIKNEIFESENFKKSLSELMDQKLPSITAYNLHSVIKKLDEKQEIYMKRKNDLIKQLGTVSEDGKQIQVMPDKMEEFIKEIQIILDVEHEYNFEKVKIYLTNTLKLSGQDIEHLSYICDFITE